MIHVFPVATEKAYREQTKRSYIMIVKGEGTKLEIKKAVETQFNVTVTSVRTAVRKGKKTRFSKGKHQYPGTTFRQDKLIAYVTLKEGDKIPVFEEKTDNKENDDKKASKSSRKGEK